MQKLCAARRCGLCDGVETRRVVRSYAIHQRNQKWVMQERGIGRQASQGAGGGYCRGESAQMAGYGRRVHTYAVATRTAGYAF